MTEATKKHIENVVIGELKHQVSMEVTPETEIETLNLDSLDTVEFLIKIEDELGIYVDDDQLAKAKTVKDIIEVVEAEI